jgi:ATP-binding cassette subfamily F protein 3
MDIIEVEEENVAAMNLRFPPAKPSGKVVLNARNMTKKYGARTIIDNQSVEIDRGDKIAFIGKNGMGKTTFSRMLVGDVAYDSGEVELGYNVTVGYYAQHAADTIDPNDTVLEVVDRVAVGEIRTRLRDLLGCFLFKGDDVFKKVKVLSGGEKSRLALCRMILEPRNFLVMDEPTNHLDMLSKEILQNALKHYEGTVVVVSHDRDFLRGLTNKIFEFTKEGIKVHLDDIDKYLEKKNLEDMRAMELEKGKDKEAKVKAQSQPKDQKPANSQPSPDNSKEISRIKKALGQAEQQIEKLEKEIELIDNQLKIPDHYNKLTADPNFFINYDGLKKQLDAEMQKWENLGAELENASK